MSRVMIVKFTEVEDENQQMNLMSWWHLMTLESTNFALPPQHVGVPPLCRFASVWAIPHENGIAIARALFYLNWGCERVGHVYLFSLLYRSHSCTCSLSHLMLACQDWLACALVHIRKSSSLGARNQNSKLTTLATFTGWAARNTCHCAALNGQFSRRCGLLVQDFGFRAKLCIYLRLTDGLWIWLLKGTALPAGTRNQHSHLHPRILSYIRMPRYKCKDNLWQMATRGEEVTVHAAAGAHSILYLLPRGLSV